MLGNPVLEFLQSNAVDFKTFQFEYEAGGGTRRSSSALGVSEHMVIKTLIFENKERQPLMVLMHGDQSVDVRRLAEQAQLSKIWSCPPDVAEEFSGWPVGATNPFVIKTPMPIYLEATVMELPKILINGGGRGFLVEISPKDLQRLVPTRLVRCAKEKPVVVSKAP